MNDEITDACLHVQRTLFKAAESLLRRPGKPVKNPEDCRFLLILLANPLLYTSEPGKPTYSNSVKSERSASQGQTSTPRPPIASLHPNPEPARRSPSTRSSSAGKYSGVIKRILGLLANASSECHLYLVNWFGRFSESHFRSLVDLIGNFVTYRLSKQHGRNCSNSHDPSGGLIPSISGPGAGTSAHLHAALSFSAVPKPPDKTNIGVSYAEDWQIKAAAKVMSLLFSANIQGSSRVQECEQIIFVWSRPNKSWLRCTSTGQSTQSASPNQCFLQHTSRPSRSSRRFRGLGISKRKVLVLSVSNVLVDTGQNTYHGTRCSSTNGDQGSRSLFQ